jgi:hypothetical protein
LDRVFVPKEKIVDYVLSTTHRDGRNKAVVFRRFGFRVEAWNELAAVLVNHARMYDIVKEESSPFGTRYVVEGVIDTPGGRPLNLRSVWFRDDGEEVPRFATAYPLKGAGRAQRT